MKLLTPSLRAHAAITLWLAPFASAQFGDPLAVNGQSLRGKVAEAADIDGDGDQDVAVGDDLGQVSWRENLGAGAFGAARPIIHLESVFDLVFADLDGDGDRDLIVAGFDAASNGVLAWHEFHSGEFGPGVLISGVVSGSEAEAADMDGDGDLDVVSYSSANEQILYFDNLGGGSISTSPTLIGSEEVISIGVADLDGDGDQDVVAGLLEFTPSGFSVFENEGGGIWTRRLVLNFAQTGRYRGFDFGDVDGDGDLDLVTRSWADSFDWYEQLTPLTFTNRQQFYVSGGARSMDLGDMDGDGDLDLLMLGSQLSWAENLGAGAFALEGIDSGPLQGGSARLADLDGSGTLDILFSSPFGPNGTRWKPNLGGGQFGADESLSVLEMSDPSEVATADFDGDGDLDVAAVSRNEQLVSVWENLGQDEFGGALTLDEDFDLPIYDVDIIAADVDGDGDPDVVVAAGTVRWYENQGLFSGQFEPYETLWANQWVTDRLLSADIDGDGLTDIVGNAPWDRAIYVLYGVAGGPDGSAPTLVGDLQWVPISIEAGDFDGDGDIDVVTSIEFSQDLWWIENLTGDTFAAPVRLGFSAGILGAHSLVAADFDQDGNLDLVTGGRFDVTWTRGVGDGTFEPATNIEDFLTDDSVYSLTVADVDGDARPDILASSRSFSGPMPDRISWARNLGLGSFEAGGSFAPDQGFVSDFLLADFDGDLDSDLLASSTGDGVVSVFPNEGGVGAGFCGPAELHSGARRASITGSGSTLIADDDLALQAFDLPLNRAGYFLVSRTQGFVPNPAGSQGNLCLGGEIGRYVSQVGNSGSTGTLPLEVRATSINQPLGSISAIAGEVWSFQCWFRDQVAGASTSNFSSGFAVRFR